MAAITFPMFTSATTGFVAAMAFIRAFSRSDGGTDIGNFYRDLVRFTNRVLMPAAFALGVLLIQQGEPQTLQTAVAVHPIPGYTAFTTGSVNAMRDSFTPLGAVALFAGMMLQCICGGKGVGFLAVPAYDIIAVFVAGLMVGRTPEFLGKKIEKPEIVLVSLTLLIHPRLIASVSA